LGSDALKGIAMAQGKMRSLLRTATDKWTEFAALIGGVLGVVLIVGVFVVGFHERQTPLRSVSAHTGQHIQP
jgi:hypothetical protein